MLSLSTVIPLLYPYSLALYSRKNYSIYARVPKKTALTEIRLSDTINIHTHLFSKFKLLSYKNKLLTKNKSVRQILIAQ